MNETAFSPTNPIIVWSIEDKPDYRQTITSLINSKPEMKCTQAFEDCESALEMLDEFANLPKPWKNPNVLLLDVELPGIDGVEGISALKERLPLTHIVMLTIRDDTDTIYDSFKAGASGYLFKDVSGKQIVAAIKEAAEGGLLMPGNVANKVLQFFKTEKKNHDEFNLTARELDVLQEMANGYTQKQMAHRLFIAPNTVNTHIQHIYQKLHVNCAPEAVAIAIRNGLII